MEIPIQVAVRIYTHAETKTKELCAGADVKATEEVATSLRQTTDTNGDNNNSNNSANEDDDLNINNNNNNIDAEHVESSDIYNDGERFCVQAIPIAATLPGFLGGPTPTALPGGGQLDSIAAGLIQVGPHTFPVTHALKPECTQSQLYHQSVFPLICLFMEGFDASVVTYGQRQTGKTYTLYGPGFEEDYDYEAQEGVVQRCVREIFAHISNQADRTYAVNIGFVEICGDAIRDLLEMGNVHCTNITEVFHYLQVGLAARTPVENNTSHTHTLFTLTLEQQWISKEGLIQHRLSTASFSDLCATERHFVLDPQEQPVNVPSDGGLHMLEQVVNTLTDPALMYNLNGNIPYTQTTLTTLLKDSFGGRAQTLLILCVSPLERDLNETICNLQFAFKVQCVRNYVIMNTFSDDNTPISPEAAPSVLPDGIGAGIVGDNFGLQFAASQWFKLVSNAEGLFAKLISSSAITDLEKEQIEEWLFLKQECEECLSSSEALRTQKLVPIEEADEPEETVSEPETSCQQNSDNETDTESQRPDLAEKVETIMTEFRLKTDTLIKMQHEEFFAKQPKAVMESQESFKQKPKMEVVLHEEQHPQEVMDERKASICGRRRSLHPGTSLTSAEIAMLNRVATREQQHQQQELQEQPQEQHQSSHDADYLDSSSGDGLQRPTPNSPIDAIQKKVRKLDADIEAHQRQIKEIEQTIQLKQNIITELVKNSETRSNAKQRFNKKKAKLEAEYEKAKKHMAKALMQGKEKSELERLRAIIAHIEQRLEDLTSMKHIAGESGQKVKKLQQSMHESKKQMEDLQKKVKKERKVRDQLEMEMRNYKESRDGSKALVKVEPGDGRQLRQVTERISHLEHILREKSENLEQCAVDTGDTELQVGLRHEIRNLRRTRDHLLEQRCSLDRKLKRDKMLSQREERKLLECDEAIEAIDAAIEFKNELICGHKSIDTSERLQREKGEQMLMARLNKLTPEEMRTLLYKYFTKVIDLRDSSRKLEVQLVQLEREREAWEWKERVLSNAVRQARLEGERNAVLLQRQHEMKLTLMLRHLAEETTASSASFSEREQRTYAFAHQQQHHHQHHRQAVAAGNSTSTPSEFDYELDFYKPQHRAAATTTTTTAAAAMIGAHKLGGNAGATELEMCSLNATDALTKYKPLEKYKDKEARSAKNNIFAKFQVLTRYAAAAAAVAQATTTTTGSTTADESTALIETTTAMAAATTTATTAAAAMAATTTTTSKKSKYFKVPDEKAVAIIPPENVKRLMAAPSATKVTRQKNKIIIQDATRKN